jgi:hypothetical protein
VDRHILGDPRGKYIMLPTRVIHCSSCSRTRSRREYIPPPAIDPILAQHEVEVYHSEWHHRLHPGVAFLKNKTIRLGSKCRNLSQQSIVPSFMMQPSSKRLNNRLNERTRHMPQVQPEGRPLRTSFANSFFGHLSHRIIEYSPGAKAG